jgi:hypothetical protein
MTLTSSRPLVETRQSWHRVAEHVLAAAQYADAGTIRLRPFPGGFATTAGVGGRLLAVVTDQLLVVDGAAFSSRPLTTLRAAAAFARVTPGLRGSYPPATAHDPDEPVQVDVIAARRLADWFALGDAALRGFAEDLGAVADPVLWPEHLDLGITVDGVNYGVSPGDVARPEPYLYVGPHEPPPPADDFWNAPFGAAVSDDRIPTPQDAAAFFAEGRLRLLTHRSGT